MDNQPTAIATTTQRPSLIASLAGKYNMDPQKFEMTVRKTVMPANATNEEFAAFLMVAYEYKLNPILREIYAYPKKGGGIQVVISIDGWVSMANQHPAMDGVSFEEHHDDKGELYACTCTIRRKDRAHPVIVTEYLSECYRATEPWKMRHRMLRHKALIQCARYAFGFSGAVDDDEALRVTEMRDVSPPPAPRAAIAPPKAPPAPPLAATAPAPPHDPQTGEIEASEYGPADAMDAGRKAFEAGASIYSSPAEWEQLRQTSLIDAFREGWREKETKTNE